MDKLESLRTAAAALATDAASRQRFAVDGAVPSAVVEPADAKELVDIVAWARAHKAALIPATSGVYLPLGNPPAAADVAVSLARLNRVRDYDPGDLTLTVEAGVPLLKLHELLAEKNQFLPALVPYFDRAAVGGAVAANVNGPLRCAYGTWRDFVLGMKFVTGEGKLVKTGGRVVKNVAGYDLAKLLIGSLGSLGILTEISFKAFPRPPGRASFVIGFRELADAAALAKRIVHSVLQPTVLELLDQPTGQLLGRAELAAHPWTLLVAVGGVERVLARCEADLGAMARDARAASFSAHLRDHPTEMWTAVRERIARARAANPAATIVKCALPLTNAGAFLDKARQVAARYELPCASSAHAASGIAYLYLLPALRSSESAGGPAAITDVARRMAQAATEMVHAGNNLGGRTTIPWCPTEVKRDVNPWGPLRDDFPLMQKLKAQFDPDRILNPGRFVGGL